VTRLSRRDKREGEKGGEEEVVGIAPRASFNIGKKKKGEEGGKSK